MNQNSTYRFRGLLPSRRRFVQGLAAASATGLFGGSPTLAQLQSGVAQSGAWPSLSGNRFDLDIGYLPVNITGRPHIATAVNGSIPAPILKWREGDSVTINVTNRLRESTSLHWHGILLPAAMDGVPGLTFPGIPPGETFTYQFDVLQSGTYWYHSHSGTQEQTGLYGPLIIEPRNEVSYSYDRDYVIQFSDWTDDDPMTIISNLKQRADYYNYQQRTLSTFFADASRDGFGAALRDRLMWGEMRMSPTDIMDVTGSTYTFLANGKPPAANWTALFTPGERVRLRLINAAAMSTFDVRIPGLELRVVQADGSDIEPVVVDEIRIGVAETYDVIVTPGNAAYTVFAQAQDRSGYARATLAPRPGMSAPVPPLDPRPLRTMADMGMDHGAMPGMDHSAMPGMDHSAMPGMDHSAMPMPGMDHGAMAAPGDVPVENADGIDPLTLKGNPNVDNMAEVARNRLNEAGTGLDGNGRRVLTYADLRALHPNEDVAPPTRAIEFHLTGNMERWIWGFDGKKFSKSAPVRIQLGERVRFILVNNTMMEHPIHLHGFFTEIENGQGNRLPLKHTINVKPGERMSYVFTAHTRGHWAFHCHLLYHMESGMFRTILVA